MSTVASTTLIALCVIIAATFAVCFGQIDTSTWEWAVGIAGGGVAGVHLSPFTNAVTGLSSSPAAKGSDAGTGGP